MELSFEQKKLFLFHDLNTKKNQEDEETRIKNNKELKEVKDNE